MTAPMRFRWRDRDTTVAALGGRLSWNDRDLAVHALSLRLPEGTVKSRINRGRTELARQVRKLRGEEFNTMGPLIKRSGAY